MFSSLAFPAFSLSRDLSSIETDSFFSDSFLVASFFSSSNERSRLFLFFFFFQLVEVRPLCTTLSNLDLAAEAPCVTRSDAECDALELGQETGVAIAGVLVGVVLASHETKQVLSISFPSST